MQRACASGVMDAAKHTCSGAPCAPRTPRGRHPETSGNLQASGSGGVQTITRPHTTVTHTASGIRKWAPCLLSEFTPEYRGNEARATR